MIDRERINSQLSLSCEKVITSCVDPGGWGGLTIAVEMITVETIAVEMITVETQVSLKNCILTCPLCFSPNKSQISQRMCKYWAPEDQWCCKKHYP